MGEAPRPSVNRWTGCWLGVLVLLVLAERWRTADEPLDRDIAGYAVIGHEMLGGRNLYTDLWERKPPLLYGTFAAAEMLVGYVPPEVLLVNVTAAVLTAAGCYSIGSAVGGGGAGLLAAGIWVLVGGGPYLEANQPNAEALVNTALTAAVAMMLLPRPRAPVKGVVVGIFFAAATLYEQHTIVICLTIAAAHVIAGGRAGRLKRLASMAWAAAVGAVIWAAVAGYFWSVGRLHAAADVLFTQLLHSTSMGSTLTAAVSPKNLFPPAMDWAIGPIGLLLMARVAGPSQGRADLDGDRRPFRIVWAGWAIGTAVVIALPGRFFPHYYQLWLPPVCVAGGLSAATLCGRTRWRPATGRIAVAGVLLAMTARQLPPYAWTPDQWAAGALPTGRDRSGLRFVRPVGPPRGRRSSNAAEPPARRPAVPAGGVTADLESMTRARLLFTHPVWAGRLFGRFFAIGECDGARARPEARPGGGAARL